jgi:hypothetical protein
MRRNEITGIIGSRSSFETFVKNGYGRYIAQIGGSEKDVPQLASLITLDDKGLQARAEKLGRPVEPAVGEEVAKLVREALNQKPQTVALLASALGAKAPTLKERLAHQDHDCGQGGQARRSQGRDELRDQL